MFFQICHAHQVINTLILMENTAAEQIKRKLAFSAMAIYVMEVWLVLIVAAAKMMIGLNVDTKNVLIMKIQSKVTSNKKMSDIDYNGSINKCRYVFDKTTNRFVFLIYGTILHYGTSFLHYGTSIIYISDFFYLTSPWSLLIASLWLIHFWYPHLAQSSFSQQRLSIPITLPSHESPPLAIFSLFVRQQYCPLR